MNEPTISTRIAEQGSELNPLKSLREALTFSSADWGAARDMAWIYGIVVGWDSVDDDGGAMEELAARFGWTNLGVARLRALHAEFERLAAPLPEDGGN